MGCFFRLVSSGSFCPNETRCASSWITLDFRVLEYDAGVVCYPSVRLYFVGKGSYLGEIIIC